MTGKLRRLALAGLTIAAVWIAFLAGTGLLVQAGWSVWRWAPSEIYNIALRFALDVWILFMWINVLPNWILGRLKIRALFAYLVSGLGSGLLTTHCAFFAWDFGVPLAYSATHPNIPSDPVLRVFTEIPVLLHFLQQYQVYFPPHFVAFGIAGVLWGLLGWRLAKPRPGAGH